MNYDNNAALAFNFSTKSWLPYALDSSVCRCTDKTFYYDVRSLFKYYMEPKEYNKYSSELVKPSYLFYNKYMVPITSNTHYCTTKIISKNDETSVKRRKTLHLHEHPIFPYNFEYMTYKYHLEEPRSSTAKYRCLMCRATLNMPIKFLDYPTTFPPKVGEHKCK